MKQDYQKLGLNHLFTPSGFHLSAVLFPFLKFLKNSYARLALMVSLGALLFFLPGFGALKRMLLVKIHQQLLGQRIGFCMAMLLDIFFGTFQNSALSFTYSFLFLGIIYSGMKGISLIIWFFIGQIVLAYFQGNDISPLLLLASPLLNFAFAMLMPLLFLLSFPLWEWQLQTGLFLLRLLQASVDKLADLVQMLPVIEVNIMVLFIIGLLLYKRWKMILIFVGLFCFSLDLDRQNIPGMPTNEFVPGGRPIMTVYSEKGVNVYFREGKCKLRLIRGLWWENCSPSKRRSKNKLT